MMVQLMKALLSMRELGIQKLTFYLPGSELGPMF